MSHPASSAPLAISDSDPASSSATTATLTPEHLLTLPALQDQIQAAVQAALTATLAPAPSPAASVPGSPCTHTHAHTTYMGC